MYSKLAALTIPFALTACMSSELGNLESKSTGLVTKPVEKRAFDADLRAACGEGGMTSTGEQSFLRWPYLQKMTSNSVEILWTTAHETELAEVRVKTPSGELVATLEPRVDPQANRPEHVQLVASVSGLEPASIYCYEIVGHSSPVWLGSSGFRTAPTRDSDEAIRVAVIGDLGTQTSDQYAVLDQLMQVPFDLVLVVGDLAYETGTLSDHELNFFDVYQDVLKHVPFFVISGNHDYANDGAVFREVFSLFENGAPEGRERWYSFDWGPIHFTAIDTEVLSDEQAAWVARDLAATDQPWKIAFLHKPPFSSGSHGNNVTVQNLFVDEFVSNGVDLVLAGHDHNYERTEPIDGVTYVVTGSAGRGTRAVTSSSFTAYSESVAHFTHLEISPEAMNINAIDGVGGDFDMATIAR